MAAAEEEKKNEDGLTEEQRKFLQECEEDFKDRYTDKVRENKI